MNKEQVELAVGAGLQLLGENSEISVPAKLVDGAFLLKHLLLAIGQGQLGLTPIQPAEVQAPPAPEVTKKGSGKQ